MGEEINNYSNQGSWILQVMPAIELFIYAPSSMQSVEYNALNLWAIGMKLRVLFWIDWVCVWILLKIMIDYDEID